jgi:colanic acid biosynthesis glycosyl transferase WcaI
MSERNPLRVLIQSINYAPELTGIGKYTGEMAEWLAARGVHVKVVTAPPYYPAWRVRPPYTAWLYRREKRSGVDVIRCPLWVPRRVTGLKRIVHLASFALSALPVMLFLGLRWRPNVVMTIEPPLLAAPGALVASRFASAQSWLHIQDFEVDAAFDLGILRSYFMRRLVTKWERAILKRFTTVSTISDRMIEHLATKGISDGHCTLFPNWADLEKIYPLAHESPLRAQWGLGKSRTVVLYAGNMGIKQGLDVLVDAATILRDTGIHFVFCGEGATHKRLAQKASGLNNVLMRPLVPPEKLNELLNIADIHVLPQRADAEDLVLPSKLTNMLASGRPVVGTAGARSQIATILDGCGLVVPPGRPDELASAIRILSDDIGRRERLGNEARRVAERLWDKNVLLKRAFASYLGETATVI